jgi:hypothetical protein
MIQKDVFSQKRQHGMIGFAVLLLAAVVVMIFSMSFFISWANFQTSLAFDSYRSQIAESAGLQQVVEESILALRSTEPFNSSKSINVEISDRLSAMSFAPGVSVTLADASSPPLHVYYPFGPAAPATSLPIFSTSTIQPGVAGVGNRALRFLASGPASDLGADPSGTAPYNYLNYTFSRTIANSSTESRLIEITARLFSVPLTNIDCIAYGLPSTGSVPTADPFIPSGFFANNSSGNVVSRLVSTLNDPARDPTCYPDLYDPNNPNSLGYQYENSVLFSWDVFELIWGSNYQNALLSAAGSTGTFDFDAPKNASIAGVTGTERSVTIDLSTAATSSGTLAVVDSTGDGRSIRILGSPQGGNLNGSPLLLYLKNTGSVPTSVAVSGDNNRPVILISRQCVLNFSGNPQFQGAIILDRNSTASGSATLFGHLSFYHAADPFPSWNLILVDSPSVKTALAPLAPRVLLVATSVRR